MYTDNENDMFVFILRLNVSWSQKPLRAFEQYTFSSNNNSTFGFALEFEFKLVVWRWYP